MKKFIFAAFFTFAALGGALFGQSVASADAYIQTRDDEWIIGTGKVEKRLRLTEGRFYRSGLADKATHRELQADGERAEEFFVEIDEPIERLSSMTEGWTLVETRTEKLSQGELQLDVVLEQRGVRATKSYILFPGSSIIRERVCYQNTGTAPRLLRDPSFLCIAAALGNGEAVDFHWMTGAENHPGSWVLKKEPLNANPGRNFDSYDPYPSNDPLKQYLGDGVDVKILLNGSQIWPENGWSKVENIDKPVRYETVREVKEGDTVSFVVKAGKDDGWDETIFDPEIMYSDGERHAASSEFGETQGAHGWRNGWIVDGKFNEFTYFPETHQWRRETKPDLGRPFIAAGTMHPAMGMETARIWTAPRAGRVRISGAVSNVGNQVSLGAGRGFRMGSSDFAPWCSWLNRETQQGIFIGWDYLGHWQSHYSGSGTPGVIGALRLAGHRESLAPGKILEGPQAFIGLFHGDLDEAGNECLQWQYQYLWEYTRTGWSPAVRILGDWWKGTTWGKVGESWVGGRGGADMPSLYRKIFRVTDTLRQIGGDVYHRDWGWWDLAGDWNGPDFKTTGEYLRNYGIGQLIYAFPYTVDLRSAVAREHPEWVLNGATLDLSLPEVEAFIGAQLDEFVVRWGPFEWRNDSNPFSPRYGDDTPLLAQDRAYRRLIRTFLDKHPDCSFQAVNSGGNGAGYDYLHYASALQFSDGEVGVVRNYYASLLFPPDKIFDIPDLYALKAYDKATWRGLLCCNFALVGDTWEASRLDGVRELIGIYHYLASQGVVGRWVRVYRPIVSGDNPEMYLQRLSRDGERGIIIPKHTPAGPVTIWPKGLLPETVYALSFQETEGVSDRTGADLMANGITLGAMAPGELIYLNLPLHPGNKLGNQSLSAPQTATKARGEWMAYPGVEIRWKEAPEEGWIAYDEVLRDGRVIDKVAKRGFYFDHSLGADLAARYEVRAVDGAGNLSPATAAVDHAGRKEGNAARIVDDSASAEIVYGGVWQHVQSFAAPVHQRTLSIADGAGATAEFEFEGKRIIWFSKLGPECGIAEVSVDGGTPVRVDTYSADEIVGVGLFQKEFPEGGAHRLKITVLGEKDEASTGTFVAVDGFRVEQE